MRWTWPMPSVVRNNEPLQRLEPFPRHTSFGQSGPTALVPVCLDVSAPPIWCKLDYMERYFSTDLVAALRQ